MTEETVAAEESSRLAHELRTIEGEELSVLRVDDRRYLIGVQVAHLLNRETFNMYRSMKIKGVELIKAEYNQVEFMVKRGAVRGGTHSVTLIPLDQALQFIHCVVTTLGRVPKSTRKKSKGRPSTRAKEKKPRLRGRKKKAKSSDDEEEEEEKSDSEEITTKRKGKKRRFDSASSSPSSSRSSSPSPARKENSDANEEGGEEPKFPKFIPPSRPAISRSRRKPANWQVYRAVRKADSVPFQLSKKYDTETPTGSADGSSNSSSHDVTELDIINSLLPSLMYYPLSVMREETQDDAQQLQTAQSNPCSPLSLSQPGSSSQRTQSPPQTQAHDKSQTHVAAGS